jgi:hypothetical protein
MVGGGGACHPPGCRAFVRAEARPQQHRHLACPCRPWGEGADEGILEDILRKDTEKKIKAVSQQGARSQRGGGGGGV